MLSRLQNISVTARLAAGATAWLIAVCWGHVQLNYESQVRPTLKMGYMPVITNLAAPILDHVTEKGDGVRFEAIKFSSFADMGAALRDGHIDAGFMIAPLAIVMRQQGVPIKLIYIGNRHESTLVVRKSLDATSVRDLVGRKIAIPMRYSGHNIALRQLAEKAGLREGEVDIFEMNPPDMGAALRTGELDGYFVGEPFAALTVRSGDAKVLHYVEDIWPGFICNLIVVTESLIESRPEDVELLVSSAARSGYWAREQPMEAARIASTYWNQTLDLTEYALTNPGDRIVYDRFTPKEDEMQELADLMVHFGLLEENDIHGLVDDTFARRVRPETVTDLQSVVVRGEDKRKAD